MFTISTVNRSVVAFAAALSCSWTFAASPVSTAEPTTVDLTKGLEVTGGFTTDYRFRGVSRTFGDPAIHGGAQYEYGNGFYAGGWASTVDKQILADSKGIEMRLYGGYKWKISHGIGLDAGMIQYVFPGQSSLSTLEAYIGATWKFVSFRYSQSLSNKFFGVQSSRGSTYYDLSARYPLWDDVVGVAQYGIQRIKDNPGDYTHVSIGLEKQWHGATWGASIHQTDTDILSTNIIGRQRDQGGRGFVFSVEKAF